MALVLSHRQARGRRIERDSVEYLSAHNLVQEAAGQQTAQSHPCTDGAGMD